mmetsp:Transcript_27560/g.88606  ORF Transcript_27560/g.88606 Transcript_27560/m.88606 type:complete len:223 (+) Transcript_27560:300-968(+)
MLEQHPLDLQSRHLVPTCLDHIDAGAAEDFVGVIRWIVHGSISRLEPAIRIKRFACSLRLVPVLPKYVVAFHTKLSGLARRDFALRVVNNAHMDTRQGTPNVAWEAGCLWMQGVAEGHPKLCHPVALKQYVSCDSLPSLQHWHRQWCRATHHEAKTPSSVTPSLPNCSIRLFVPRLKQLRVDGRHRHEECQVGRAGGIDWSSKSLPHTVRMKRGEFHTSTRP